MRCLRTPVRDQYGNEVDIVIEDTDGRLVGIEVKASATVNRDDFSGLRKLAEACGKKFVLGMVCSVFWLLALGLTRTSGRPR